jgi:hypothetical protein
MSNLTVIDEPLSEEERRALTAAKDVGRKRLESGVLDIRPDLHAITRGGLEAEVRRLQILVFRLLKDRPASLSRDADVLEKTPNGQMERALRDTMAFLSRLPDTDELCDRIIGILEPGACGIDGCKEKAGQIVWDRAAEQVVRCCFKHSDEIIYQDSPAYVKSCPNCGCDIPVG